MPPTGGFIFTFKVFYIYIIIYNLKYEYSTFFVLYIKTLFLNL